MRHLPALLICAFLATPACLHAEAAEAWIHPLPHFEPGAKAVVVASIDEVFRVQRIGETIFGNKAREYPVPGWQLADPLELFAAQTLSHVATLPAIALGDEAMRARFRGFRPGQLTKRADRERMRAAVIEVGKSSGAAYVVVVGGNQPVRDPFFNSNVSTPPFGIVQDDRPFKPGALLQSHLELLIFDGRSGAQLSFAVQTQNAPRTMLAKNAEPDAREIEELRSEVLNLFQLAVATSLRDMRELRDERR